MAPFLTNDFWQNIKILLSLKWFKIFCRCLFYYKDNNLLVKIKSSVWKYVSKFSCCCCLGFFGEKSTIFFFKNTCFKNYQFYTGDHYLRVPFLKRTTSTSEFNRSYKQWKYFLTWNQFPLPSSHILVSWKKTKIV